MTRLTIIGVYWNATKRELFSCLMWTIVSQTHILTQKLAFLEAMKEQAVSEWLRRSYVEYNTFSQYIWPECTEYTLSCPNCLDSPGYAQSSQVMPMVHKRHNVLSLLVTTMVLMDGCFRYFWTIQTIFPAKSKCPISPHMEYSQFQVKIVLKLTSKPNCS